MMSSTRSKSVNTTTDALSLDGAMMSDLRGGFVLIVLRSRWSESVESAMGDTEQVE
jgi:hypothetical protein